MIRFVERNAGLDRRLPWVIGLWVVGNVLARAGLFHSETILYALGGGFLGNGYCFLFVVSRLRIWWGVDLVVDQWGVHFGSRDRFSPQPGVLPARLGMRTLPRIPAEVPWEGVHGVYLLRRPESSAVLPWPRHRPLWPADRGPGTWGRYPYPKAPAHLVLDVDPTAAPAPRGEAQSLWRGEFAQPHVTRFWLLPVWHVEELTSTLASLGRTPTEITPAELNVRETDALLAARLWGGRAGGEAAAPREVSRAGSTTESSSGAQPSRVGAKHPADLANPARAVSDTPPALFSGRDAAMTALCWLLIAAGALVLFVCSVGASKGDTAPAAVLAVATLVGMGAVTRHLSSLKARDGARLNARRDWEAARVAATLHPAEPPAPVILADEPGPVAPAPPDSFADRYAAYVRQAKFDATWGGTGYRPELPLVPGVPVHGDLVGPQDALTSPIQDAVAPHPAQAPPHPSSRPTD